jgi:hypothetical protein
VQLETERGAVRSQRQMKASETARVRDELMQLAGSWRRILVDDPAHARPIVSSLLVASPSRRRSCRRGTSRAGGTLTGLFSREMFCICWRPHHDKKYCIWRGRWRPNGCGRVTLLIEMSETDNRSAVWGGATGGLIIGLVVGFFRDSYWWTVLYAVLIGAGLGAGATLLAWIGSRKRS